MFLRHRSTCGVPVAIELLRALGGGEIHGSIFAPPSPSPSRDFSWKCGNAIKTQATIIQPEIMDNIYVCIRLSDFLLRDNACSVL